MRRSGLYSARAFPLREAVRLWLALFCFVFIAAVACESETTVTPAPTPIPATAAPKITRALASTATPRPTATATSTETSRPTPTAQPGRTTAQLSIYVASVPEGLPAYDRDDWRHWIDVDGDCQNTRHEVLIEESRITVTYKSDRRCQVEAGRWFGAYTSSTVTQASELDVDHMVPLANAHRSGGWAWGAERKRRYANSLDDPDHLIAVTAGANRSKGAKGPGEWKPPNRSYWCEYSVDWIRIKETWELTVTPGEAAALQDMLATCGDPPLLVVTQAGPISLPANPTPAPTVSNSYASCDEAMAAGERRVRGSKGPGRGFPKAKVPSARDGDGDGVVCEK